MGGSCEVHEELGREVENHCFLERVLRVLGLGGRFFCGRRDMGTF